MSAINIFIKIKKSDGGKKRERENIPEQTNIFNRDEAHSISLGWKCVV